MKTLIIFCFLCFCSLAVSKILNLEELAAAITQYNKGKEYRITSLEDIDRIRYLIKGSLSVAEYKKKYKLTNEQLTKKIFENVYHLTPEELPQVIVNWNKDQTSFGNTKFKINSILKFNTFCNRIYGVLSSKTYQTLYDITSTEFLHMVFRNNDSFLSLQQLPLAINEYHKHTTAHHIVSIDTYERYHSDIEGALPRRIYQILNNIDTKEFVRFVFSRIKHLTPEELLQAIKDYHNKIKSIRVFSLKSYAHNRIYIPGALSLKTYQMLYGVKQDEFKEMLKSVNHIKHFTAEEINEYQKQQEKQHSKLTQGNGNNKNVPFLTMKQTSEAIMAHNSDVHDRHSMYRIDSWASYRKHRKKIPGADSIGNLERQYLEEHGTLSGFLPTLLGVQNKTLTPLELSKAIAKYNSEVYLTEQIDYIEDYETLYYRILHAPTLEAFIEYARENWNDQFQDKFGTINKFVEHIIVRNSCMKSLGK